MNERITRYAPYLWLVYLASLLIQPAFDPAAGAGDWLAAAAMIVVFLPLYRASLGTRDQHRLELLLASMAALGVVGSLINAGAGVLVVYAAALTGRLQPVRRAAVAIAVLLSATGVMFLISPVPMPWRLLAIAPVSMFAVVVGASAIIDAERDRNHALLRRADEEIERLATIAERERIARDLHDLLGHTLSVIVLKSELAARLVHREPARAEQEARDVEQTARTALTEVRAAVAGYRAKGIGAEAANAQRALAAAGVEVELTIDLPTMPARQEAALALALREAVTNVVRHAHARHVTIHGFVDGHHVVLDVADDGRGGGTSRDGAGLSGMRERVGALGGQVTRHDVNEAAHARGTLVRVTLPRAPQGLTVESPTVGQP